MYSVEVILTTICALIVITFVAVLALFAALAAAVAKAEEHWNWRDWE